MAEKGWRLSHWEERDLAWTDARQAPIEADKIVSDIFQQILAEVGFEPETKLTDNQFSYLCSVVSVTEGLDQQQTNVQA